MVYPWIFNEYHSHKDDEADDGIKDDGHNAIWVAHEFPVHACDGAEHDGPNASASCCIFPIESLVGMRRNGPAISW